ncbi:hypothetical protein Tsubulata_016556, partial [Turnera subulata]
MASHPGPLVKEAEEEEEEVAGAEEVVVLQELGLGTARVTGPGKVQGMVKEDMVAQEVEEEAHQAPAQGMVVGLVMGPGPGLDMVEEMTTARREH